MTTHEYVAGAFALPVVVALASIDPALGLVVGFAVFAATRKALPLIRRPRRQLHSLPEADTEQRIAA